MSDWRTRAACRGKDPEMFWAPAASAEYARAAETCEACPVAAECAAEGRRKHEFGRWGAHYRPGACDEREAFHAEVNGYVCPGCAFTFRTASGLKAHLRADCQCRECAFATRPDCERWQVANLEEQLAQLERDWGKLA